MNIITLLEMATSGAPDRTAITYGASSITYEELRRHASAIAGYIRKHDVPRVVYLSGNEPVFPASLFGCAAAGVPLVPLNYRLGNDQLDQLMQEQPRGTVIVGDDLGDIALPPDAKTFSTGTWWAMCSDEPDCQSMEFDENAVAVLLYTSGTSAAPKAAMLRHHHLTSYILGSVDFGAASDVDAALVAVPPYHIAGIASVLSNVYSGRRIVYLDRFTPEGWVDAVRRERATNAMLVPTMLARVVNYLDASNESAPAIRHLAYGGARMPIPVIQRALELFPDTDFVNAYGLTETSSTIAVLGPDDHRTAAASSIDVERERLGSAGKLVSGLEVEIRGSDGEVMPSGEVGEMWVRGPQVSGEYIGRASVIDADGWFPTKDLVRVDKDGYLFVIGRLDDTIIRGGENISPAEIEDVILRHTEITECAVVGIPDDEWGQRIGAAIVLKEDSTLDPNALTEWLKPLLRTSKTPDEIRIWSELPQTGTGKVVRRLVLQKIVDGQCQFTSGEDASGKSRVLSE